MRRWWPRSLFGRLLLLQAALAAVLAVALPVLLSHTLAATADGFVADRLERRADAIAARVSQGRGGLRLPADAAAGQADGARRAGLFDEGGRLLVAGAAGAPLPLATLPHGDRPAFARRGRFDVLTRPIRGGDHVVGWVVVAEDRTHPEEIVDDVVRAFLRWFFWVVPAALLASLAVSLLVMRRMTSNVRRAAADADRIGVAYPDARIDEAPLPSETAPLVHAANRAIDRMRGAYRAQKEFASAVAHELRTPLALLSLHTEALPPSPARDRLQADIAQANHVVRQLMDLAAVDRLHPALAPVDPVAVARDTVEAMVPLVYRAGHTVALEAAAAPPPVRGVPALLGIALANLVENAVRHTPPGTAIAVIVERDGSLVVEDDGPGLAFDRREDATRRFRRGDTARSDSAGLGLAIVERIMTACDGTLEVGQRTGGGARLRLRLMPDRGAAA